MNTKELKNTLLQKLMEEGTCFTASDISIRKMKNLVNDGPEAMRARVTIKGYEPWAFDIMADHGELGYDVAVFRMYDGKFDGIAVYVESSRGFRFDDAMIELGYYIGTRF